MVSTVLLRLVLTLPAHVTQQKVMAKRFIMAEEMKREILPAIQKMTDRSDGDSLLVCVSLTLSLQARHS